MPALEPSIAPAQRLDAVVRRAMRALDGGGDRYAGLDARLLVAAATGLGVGELIARPEQPVAAENMERLDALVRRRCTREPVSRILGEREFYGRTFLVTPAALDPRPDSETLIEAALAIAGESRLARASDPHSRHRHGLGRAAATLLAELPLATGLGTDMSEDALQVAEVNADRLGVGERATFARHDALEGIEGHVRSRRLQSALHCDGEIAGLTPEVRDYDPHAALDGGSGRPQVYRKIIPHLTRVLASRLGDFRGRRWAGRRC